MRGVERAFLLVMVLLLAGCAGDTYAPVTDRTADDAASSARSGEYRVVRGDTLYSIAFRHDLDHRPLARWNDINEPYTIYPGQVLRLSAPAAGSAARDAAGSTQRREPRRTAASTPEPPAPSPGPARASSSSPGNWIWPADGELVKSFSADADGKQGINISGEDGSAVRASAAGRVVYSGSGLVGYGNLLIIKHGDEYLTAYGYNRELLVSEGDQVGQGDVIARMGRNGGRPMLHFELRRDGQAVDPTGHLPAARN